MTAMEELVKVLLERGTDPNVTQHRGLAGTAYEVTVRAPADRREQRSHGHQGRGR